MGTETSGRGAPYKDGQEPRGVLSLLLIVESAESDTTYRIYRTEVFSTLIREEVASRSALLLASRRELLDQLRNEGAGFVSSDDEQGCIRWGQIPIAFVAGIMTASTSRNPLDVPTST